jgi:predicted PurR-regulated permease PerM
MPVHERSAGRDGSTLRRFRPLIIFATAALITTALYAARPVFIPVALAVLLAFLLTPAVNQVQRRGLGRVPAVILVVVLVFSALGGATWMITSQITTLVDELPRYRANLRQKISDLRGAQKGTALEKVQSTAKEVLGELNKQEKAAKPEERPVPVVVRSDWVGLWGLPTVLEGLASAGLVIVLLIFMLIERHEMRNRLIRLIGYGRLAITTRALDDAAQRIIRYLLMQSTINASFGLAVGVGLLLIGLPYALLWAILAGLLRFIPYVGTWMAAVMPITLALAVFPSWRQPLLVIALFVILEPLIYLVIEPLLYGHSAGVSQVALLVAIAFWTWLWGPVGLVLATPLTVCLVVLGKYVPELEFITVLMSDGPALEPDISYYQRLLADDDVEAMEIVQRYVREHPKDAVYDSVLVTALARARRDREHGRLTDGDEQILLRTTGEVLEELRGTHAGRNDADGTVEPLSLPSCRTPVLGLPGRDEIDELALTMFRDLAATIPCEVEVISAHMLTSEILDLVAEKRPGSVVIGLVTPGGLAQARYLAKRLRGRFPDVRILIGRWGATAGSDESGAMLLRDGANAVGTTLLESREQLARYAALASPWGESAEAAAPAPVEASPGVRSM